MAVDRPEGLIPGSGRRMPSRSLAQVVSVRFDGAQLAAIRALAEGDGVTVSEWIRNAAGLESFRRSQPPAHPELGRIVGWTCEHFTMTSMPGILGKPTMSGCGCEMSPVYECTQRNLAA